MDIKALDLCGGLEIFALVRLYWFSRIKGTVDCLISYLTYTN